MPKESKKKDCKCNKLFNKAVALELQENKAKIKALEVQVAELIRFNQHQQAKARIDNALAFMKKHNIDPQPYIHIPEGAVLTGHDDDCDFKSVKQLEGKSVWSTCSCEMKKDLAEFDEEIELETKTLPPSERNA